MGGFLWSAAHLHPKRSPETPAFLPRCFTFLWGCHRDVRLPRVLRTLRRTQRATHTSRWPAAHQCRADTSTVFGARPWKMWRQCHCVPASEANWLCWSDLRHATPELHDTCTCLPRERTCTRQTQARTKQRAINRNPNTSPDLATNDNDEGHARELHDQSVEDVPTMTQIGKMGSV